jgi:hypothetical protein
MRDVGFSERGCELEHKGWRIIQKQRKNGFWFNIDEAHALFTKLRAEERELKEKIHERFPPEEQLLANYKKATKADGTPTANFERHSEQFKRLVVNPGGDYDAYGDVEFDLGSPAQRVAKLVSLGWVPEEFTKPSKTHPDGQPKATEHGHLTPSLERFVEESGIEEVRLIAEWMAVNGRANMINNWMDVYNDNTHCIHGNLWLANTLRYRHDKPNTANIPAVRLDDDEKPIKGEEGYWTYEARDLWQTRNKNNRKLVGVDAKGIQLRVLANYINNPDFTEAILSSDPHSANQAKWGLPNRKIAKTIVYAITMGAGDKRIAQEAKMTLKEAKASKKVFFDQVPEFQPLVAKLKRELKTTGRIKLCDGTPVMVSQDYMVIPYLLQGDESRIMRQAAVYVDEEVRRRGLDVLKVGDIHDEWQNDVRASDVEEFIRVCEECFRRAGVSFNYNLPIECDAKEGLTWAETH